MGWVGGYRKGVGGWEEERRTGRVHASEPAVAQDGDWLALGILGGVQELFPQHRDVGAGPDDGEFCLEAQVRQHLQDQLGTGEVDGWVGG